MSLFQKHCGAKILDQGMGACPLLFTVYMFLFLGSIAMICNTDSVFSNTDIIVPKSVTGGHVTNVTLVLIAWSGHLAWRGRMSNMAGAGCRGGNGTIATISTHAAPSGRGLLAAPGHMSGQHCSSIHNPGTGWCGLYALCALHSMHYMHCTVCTAQYS